MVVPDVLFRWLAREWAGLSIAFVVTVFGLLLVRAVGGPPWLLGVVCGVGAMLALASLRHLAICAQTRRRHPPPGQRVDVGGYSLHVLAEGVVREGRPPIVWFAGGHASGYAIHHLHRVFRSETRSILIDRPGTGWSDTGPFPRTTAREAEEVVRALHAAGERGPFVWAGHSFGGLLCANVARRHPALVHTLVLLDPTPLETIIFGPRFDAIRDMQRGALIGGVAQLFGINLGARARRAQVANPANPAHTQLMLATEAALGPEVLAARAVEARAGVSFAAASIYRELSPEGAGACGWDAGVYEGDLGDMPVLLVAPLNDLDAAALPETQSAEAADAHRAVRILARTRERYLATSTRSRRVVAPPGSGHNFVYEVPEFVVEVVRGVLHDKR